MWCQEDCLEIIIRVTENLQFHYQGKSENESLKRFF